MFKKLLISLVMLSSVLLGSVALLPATAHAASCDRNANFLGIPAWYKYLSPTTVDGKCELTLPKDNAGRADFEKALPPILLAIFEIVLRIGGMVAVGFVIYGGFQYILSQGEPDNLKGARSTILNALIGLAIAVSATAIVNLIGNNVVR